mgnify:CR=1 FL=1
MALAADLPEKKESSLVKGLKLFLKIAVTVFCFWYISRKLDLQKSWESLLQANPLYVVLAVLSFAFSKLLAAFRLNINFRNIGVRLTEWRNIKLYWLGMFYNLFLPGSISGDAYKVVLLRRQLSAPVKKTGAAVLLDRFSGLLALGIILAICAVRVLPDWRLDALFALGAAVAIVATYLGVRFFFTDFLPGFWPTFFWGMAVQVFQVVCLYCVLLSLNIHTHTAQWIFIFLIASVISVLPLSLGGGLGTRELVFVEGAKYFSLDPHLALIISLLFYLSNLLSSVWGVYFIFHPPLKNYTAPAATFAAP